MAFGVAFANVVLETGVSVSHLTGDISRLSMDLSHWSPEALTDAGRVAAATLSFFLGAVLSGYLIHHPSLDLARPYGRAITGIGLLFIVAGLIIPYVPVLGIAAAAFGCGLQNPLSTNYEGMIHAQGIALSGNFRVHSIRLPER